MKKTLLICFLGLSLATTACALTATPSAAEVCQPVNGLCAASDVLDTLEQNGPTEGMVKIVFANVGGRDLAFAVSNNIEEEYFGVTVAESHYSDEITAANVDTPITSFRLHYDATVSNVVGEDQETDSFLSLVGKAFSYGNTSIEVTPEDFVNNAL